MSISVPALNKNSYDWDKRIEVVKCYIITGSLRRVSEATGVHLKTLTEWRDQEWWSDITAEIKKQREAKLDNKLSNIVEKALEVVEDRLNNGDLVLNNKTGELIRKPVPLREASKAANELLARQQQLQKNSEGVTIQQTTVKETLNMLANEFSKWNRNQSKKEATTIEFKEVDSNAIHEEWETGLPAGGGKIHFETGSSQEEDPTERSSQGSDEGRPSP